MGVDFYPCQNPDCHQCWCDCGYYFHCVDCERSLCEECSQQYSCGKYAPREYDDRNEDCTEDFNCPFCTGELITDKALLEFAIELTELSREEVITQYNRWKAWQPQRLRRTLKDENINGL